MTSDSSPQTEGSRDQPALEYSSFAQRQIQTAFEQLRERLAQFPPCPECIHCGRPAAGLWPVAVSHEDFHCTVPLPVCTWCSGQPPFIARTRDWRVVLTLLAAAVSIPVVFIAPAIVIVFIVWVTAIWFRSEPPVVLTPDERRGALRAYLCRWAELHTLLEVFPDARCDIGPRVRRLSLDKINPVEFFQNQAACHEHVRVVSSYDDLQRSGVSTPLLAALIGRTSEIVREVMRAQSPSPEMVVQVDLAVLPGRWIAFDILSSPRASQELRDELTRRLNTLPAVPANFPVMFSLRRGARPGEELPAPFTTWWLQLGSPAEITYANIALRVHDVGFPDPPVVLMADECGRWNTLLPNDDDLRLLHAGLLRGENRIDEAVAVVEQRLPQVSQNPLARFRYATFLEELERVERAAAVSRQLIADFPEFTEAFGYFAHLQLKLNLPKDAEKTFVMAPRQDRSAGFWHTGARIALANEDRSYAELCLTKAIETDPAFPPPYELRAQLHANAGEFEPALASIDQFHQNGGTTLDSLQLNAALLKKLGRHDEAVQVFSKALEHSPEHPLLLYLKAEALADAGKLELARAEGEQILARLPGFPLALQLLARVCLELHEGEACEAHANMAIANGLETCPIFMYRGLARVLREDNAGAHEDLARACQLDPDNVIARYHRCRLKASENQAEEALAEVAEIVEQAPEWHEPRVLRGFLSLGTGDLDTAEQEFDWLIEHRPTLSDAWRGRALVHEARNELTRALERLDQGLTLDPENADMRLVRSRILVSENDLEAAERDLDAALHSIPDLLPALLSRAHVRLQLGEYDQAQKDFDAILREHPEFTPALIGRSLLWDQTGKPERSQEDLEAAVESSPENAQEIEISHLLMKAALAHHSERFDDAIAAATEVLELDPENEAACRVRAGSYWYADLFVEAAQDYTTLLDVQEMPEASTYNGRGQVYAEMGEFDLALEDLEKSVELARAAGGEVLAYCLNGLGKALTGLGRIDAAEAAFQESLALRPGNAWLQFNRGLLYLTKEDRKSAAVCFEQALELTNPRLPPGKRARARGFLERMKGAESG
jgi:tetratricopeptide (TPR) repeat protein